MDLEPRPPVDKAWIKKRTTPEKIFEHYLGVEVRPGYKFCNPLRPDDNPTCKFYYSGGEVYFSDFAVQTAMDCFDLVMWHYNCGFQEALYQIADDMGLADVDASTDTGEWSTSNIMHGHSGGHRTSIKVRTADFTKKDVKYLKSHGIGKEQTEKFWCYGIDHIWVNGTHIWMRAEERPAIGYYFGTDEEDVQMWKIYFYEDDSDRFLCNTGVIQGWPQLPDTGDVCVITKSLKDVMALDAFGITACAPQGESIPPPTAKVEELKDRFDHVYSLYDFDYAGVRMANQLRRECGIPALFLTNGDYGTVDFGAKDFSDYVRDFGRHSTWDLIDLARRTYLPTDISSPPDTNIDGKLSFVRHQSDYMDPEGRGRDHH